MTDDPLLSTIAVDTVTLDPNDHNTIYAGTGDLNFGSFSMGSQGILKSTDAGATWTLLGADVFGPGFPLPPGQFPQYQAVGKVRVDPAEQHNVVAGTRRDLLLLQWRDELDGPLHDQTISTRCARIVPASRCSNTCSSTAIIAAVGAVFCHDGAGESRSERGQRFTRNSAGQRMPVGLHFVSTNSNGWTGLNPTSGTAYITRNRQPARPSGYRVAPSNSNYIYAQVQSTGPTATAVAATRPAASSAPTGPPTAA